MKVYVNLNATVRFRLTAEGLMQLEAFWFPIAQRLRKPLSEVMPKPAPDSVYTMQLWSFMEVFGPAMHLAGDCLVQGMTLEVELDNNTPGNTVEQMLADTTRELAQLRREKEALAAVADPRDGSLLDRALQMALLREIAAHADHVCDLFFNGCSGKGRWDAGNDRRMREASGYLNAALLRYKEAHGAP